MPAAISSAWTVVSDFSHPEGWTPSQSGDERSRQYCRQLEAGSILFFASVPFDLPNGDREFLISQTQTESRFHKNISYRPKSDALRGTSTERSTDRARLHRVMRDYSASVTAFVRKFLTPYASKMALDFASFRPLEEESRNLPTHKRNDLLHVDAFPTRPTHGSRIMRVFTNISPQQPRIWLTGEPFHALAPRFAPEAGLQRYAKQSQTALFKLRSGAASALRSMGLPVANHSGYDLFMLHFHDWLKDNAEYQNGSDKKRSEFPAGCSWMVFTDGVPHAALSGRYALEHTYIVPRDALVAPELAPISVLENLSGVRLAG